MDVSTISLIKPYQVLGSKVPRRGIILLFLSLLLGLIAAWPRKLKISSFNRFCY